uniref:Uncharacterized protein n=1 Tax=Anguilla anguilla TaxID=7936 RepID=A0A0E9RU73_ANGAN
MYICVCMSLELVILWFIHLYALLSVTHNTVQKEISQQKYIFHVQKSQVTTHTKHCRSWIIM